MVIDGKKIAQRILQKLKLLDAPKRFLVAFLLGEDPASVSFLKQKAAVAKELGIEFRLARLSQHTTSEKLHASIEAIASQPKCGGVLVQLPLPVNIGKENISTIMNAVSPGKDVDVLSEHAYKLFETRSNIIRPPAASVVIKILEEQYSMLAELLEKRVAVVGVGLLVGAPIITLLEGKTRTFGKFRRGSDLSLLNGFDLVILGTGAPGLVKPEMLREGAGVIDFGYGRQNGKLCGDLDVNNINELGKLSFYTPTPGGTGPVLVAQLFENFYKLNGIKVPG